jgi:hypothetical protein
LRVVLSNGSTYLGGIMPLWVSKLLKGPRPAPLQIVLGIDGIMMFAFGALSAHLPDATYATIVDVAGAGSGTALVMALCHSLSIFYVVLGYVALLAARMPIRMSLPLAGAMVVQHGWSGAQKWREVGSEWLIGNPWPDIVIHLLFVLAYLLATLRARRAIERLSADVPAV